MASGSLTIALENAAWKERKRREERPENGGRKRELPLELPFPIREEGKRLIADRRTLVEALLRELSEEGECGIKPERAQALALAMCRRLRERTGIRQTALSGGVFANVLLQERCRALLEADGFSVYVNEQVPGNDGGICLGQAWIALQD